MKFQSHYLTPWPPVKVTCAACLCIAGRITGIASLNLKHRLCLQRCGLHFSWEEHLTCNEFVSDQKLLIICAVSFPQDHGKAITCSYVKGLYKSVPSQAVARVSKRTTNQVQEPDGQWNKGNESRWYSRVEELQTGLAQPIPHTLQFVCFSGKTCEQSLHRIVKAGRKL